MLRRIRTSPSPAVVDGVIYVRDNDGIVCALDAVIGSERRRIDTGSEVYSLPVVVDSVVYVGSLNGAVYALEAA